MLLPDVNVWFAMAFDSHVHHPAAKAWFDALVAETACFCRMTQQRNLDQLKRSQFKELMRDLIREKYGVALRNDVPDNENKQQQAWKGLAVVDAETLAA